MTLANLCEISQSEDSGKCHGVIASDWTLNLDTQAAELCFCMAGGGAAGVPFVVSVTAGRSDLSLKT